MTGPRIEVRLANRHRFTTVNDVVEVQAFTLFLRTLIKPQREALKRFTILLDGYYPGASITSGELKDLVNVKRLSIIVTGADTTSFGGLHKLARLPVKEVDISFHVPWYNEGRGAQIQEAADSLRAHLLRPWEEIEMEEKSGAEQSAVEWKDRVSKRESFQDRRHTLRAGRALRNMKNA
ncbi:hypothetical protein Slin15195_G035590 [Septoria linicola]|uniref:Uncharacterized protein n=1 Tax=Septoria linicola TaxID=215465 RepID=A0A9Q9AJL7_9PEZI|nr:hypothetical protein Slin14017_G116950 [Septoria linicola]USW50240.1 hypothetical protein Slin15195_G035590 [Septoria linicola]